MFVLALIAKVQKASTNDIITMPRGSVEACQSLSLMYWLSEHFWSSLSLTTTSLH